VYLVAENSRVLIQCDSEQRTRLRIRLNCCWRENWRVIALLLLNFVDLVQCTLSSPYSLLQKSWNVIAIGLYWLKC